MPKGVKIKDLTTGTGRELVKGEGMTAIAKARYFLNGGDELWTDQDTEDRIEVDRRNIIAGLRYGMIGMRVGGKRTLRICPHLAFGKGGNGDSVPPDAVLLCEVELVGIEEPREPEATTRVRQVFISKWGQGMESFQSASFLVNEKEEVSYGCLNGRDRIRLYDSRFQLPGEARIEVVAEAVRILEQDREDCLFHSQIFTDLAPLCLQMRRETATGAPCVQILVSENGQKLASYYLREDSPQWLNSYMARIMAWLIAQANPEPEKTPG